MKYKLKIKNWNFAAAFIFVNIFGIIITVYSLIYVDGVLKKSMASRSGAIAGAMDIEDISQLTGTSDDLESPVYAHVKEKLSRVAELNPDIRFVYLVGKQNDDIFFYADSEDPSTGESSRPGEIYFEASADFHRAFDEKINMIEGPLKDQWGTWMSAFTPIIDSNSDKVIAVAGIDIDARDYSRALLAYSVIPILLTVVLIFFAFVIWRAYKKEKEFSDYESELVFIASHELKSPLLGINWAVNFLSNFSQNENLSDDQKEILSALKRSSDHLMEVIEDVLDIAVLKEKKKMGLRLEPCDLAEAINEAVQTLELFAKEKSISVSMDKTMPPVIDAVCDEAKIKRALLSIISNAIKYSSANSFIAVKYKKTQEFHIISVADQGVGIPENEKQFIFQKARRANNVSQIQGAGLGLYFAKNIIEAHGGKIWFEVSENNNGTVFYIAIPLNME